MLFYCGDHASGKVKLLRLENSEGAGSEWQYLKIQWQNKLPD